MPGHSGTDAIKKEATRIIASRLGSLTLMSDYMFTAFMQNNNACMQVVLRAFTDDDSIIVTKVMTQYVVKNDAEGRGVRFDSLVETADGTLYNLEVENRPDGSLELRLRYYAVMLDKENLKKGDKFRDMPPVVNIVIMPKDIRGLNKPLYFVRRVFVESLKKIGEKPASFEDKTAFIYVNATYRNTDTLVGKVIHDLTTPGNTAKLVKEIAVSMEKFISTEEGRKEMSATIAEYGLKAGNLEHLLSDTELTQAREYGRAQGWQDGQTEILQQLADMGILSRENLTMVYQGRELPNIKFAGE